jgi:hypothetical protein
MNPDLEAIILNAPLYDVITIDGTWEYKTLRDTLYNLILPAIKPGGCIILKNSQQPSQNMVLQQFMACERIDNKKSLTTINGDTLIYKKAYLKTGDEKEPLCWFWPEYQ